MSNVSDTFHLVVASVGQTRFDGAAASVTLPGASGTFTVLPHHEPLVSTLGAGTITVKDASGAVKEIEIEKGLFECSPGRVVVIL